MPLSDHEQRLLEQMERALYAEDPKLASTLRGSSLRHQDRRRLALGAVGFVLGTVLLVSGVATTVWAIGVAGFLVLLGSGWLVVGRWQGRAAAPATTATAGPSAAPKVKQRRSFMNRMEERWERRRDEDGR